MTYSANYETKDFTQARAVGYVLAERDKQEEKWGEQNHDPITYLAILTEEVGEFAQAALETKFGGKNGGLSNMRKEALHTAAVALAIVECLDRMKWEWPDKEKDLLSNLLAVIHSDGGHYQAEHGTEKAVKDAIEKYYTLRSENDR